MNTRCSFDIKIKKSEAAWNQDKQKIANILKQKLLQEGEEELSLQHNGIAFNVFKHKSYVEGDDTNFIMGKIKSLSDFD